MIQNMAGMTQKELKKPYFHCGPIMKGNFQKFLQTKDFKETKTSKKKDQYVRYLQIYLVED